jgi:hypothetical protein
MIAIVIDGRAYVANSERRDESQKGKAGKRGALFARFAFLASSQPNLQTFQTTIWLTKRLRQKINELKAAVGL